MKRAKQKHATAMAPRLRMICNGDHEVSTLRSALSASVAVPRALVDQFSPGACLEAAHRHARQATDHALGAPPPQQGAPDEVRVSCFAELHPGETLPEAYGDAPGRGTLRVLELSLAEANALVDRDPRSSPLSYLETGDPLSEPVTYDVPRRVAAPAHRIADPGWQPVAGDVLIGLIDVGGFDFAHEDFLDEHGDTRFLAIWDQGGKSGPGVPFGRVLERAQMNRALRAAQKHRVDPAAILRQSQQFVGSHGTHTASIAAGNRGVCPHAQIAGVLLSLSDSESERSQTLFDSTRLALAVDWLFALAQGRPTVINISLGTNGHAHDGTSPISRWIDSALMQRGRCVCVAAGNAGQEGPRFSRDIGQFSGRIHASGKIASRGLDFDLQWIVVGDGIIDVSENEMEIWYPAGDELEVSVRSPSGDIVGPVRPGQFYENHRLPSETFVSIYSECYHPANGQNRISIFLSPRLKQPVVGVEAGTWTVRLHGVEIRDGRFDAWIERDDPRLLGQVGESQVWQFPSFFGLRSNVDRSSVSSLACSRHVIAVGNANAALETIHPSSSQGPTWDGRPKPDVVAPGTEIVAARGFCHGDANVWTAKTGTSMASPYVAGVAACMLSIEPRLTASQILGIMRRSAQPLPGTDYSWQHDAGFGPLRPSKCLESARQPFTAVDLDPPREGER